MLFMIAEPVINCMKIFEYRKNNNRYQDGAKLYY